MSISRRRFRILKEIAEGGFGKVYLAEQISSDGFSRIVAIKLLHSKWSTHDEVVKRTRDEARVLGRIRHQHIVKVEDLTSIESKCAIVMEYLEGVDLKWMCQFLKERKLLFPRAALFEIVLAVASALDAAYSGIPLQGDQPLKAIHRDIKPSNIFVTVAGGVKVLDFGTARANFAEREAKTMALAFGSQGYMAPERMLGEEDTPAADVFSLGITLYELLTLESFGRIPPRPNKFNKKMDERVASVPLEGDPDWIQQVRDTLRLMLSYAPTDRPSAAQLAEIMDLLAQEASDTALRRYCRTLVQEAKDALPVLATDDPLIGTIVDEDESGPVGPVPVTMEINAGTPLPSSARGGSSSAEVLEPPRQSPLTRSGSSAGEGGDSDVPETVLNAGTIDRSGSPSGTASTSRGRSVPGSAAPPPPPLPQNVRTVVPGLDPVSTSRSTPLPSPLGTPSGSQARGGSSPSGGAVAAPNADTVLADPSEIGTMDRGTSDRGNSDRGNSADPLPPPPPEARGSALPTLVAVGLATLLVIAVIGGFVAVLALTTVVVVSTDGGDTEVAPPGDDDVAEGGQTIVERDGRANAARVPTVLKYSGSGGAKVDIRGPGGFHARWDGAQPFDLGAAGEGEYKANVTPTGASTLRLKKFSVDATKKQCTFTFDPSAEEWVGGCT
jgi:serine/threonine protein kinase